MEISTILQVILILGFLGAVIYIIYIKSRTEEYPTHNVRVICYMRQFSNGYKEGWFVKRIWGKNRSIIEFQPTDIDYNKSQTIKNQRIVVSNSLLDTFSVSKGIESNDIGYMYLFPPRADLFSKQDLKMFGNEFVNRIEKISETDNIVEIMRNREILQNTLLNKKEGGGRMAEYVKEDRAFTKDMITKMKDFRDDKKYSGYSNPAGSSGV